MSYNYINRKINLFNVKKNNIIILSLFIFLTLGIVLFNYANQLTSLIAEAVAPNPGHSWSELECTNDLCVTSTGVGIGTLNPTAKLHVNGLIIQDGAITTSSPLGTVATIGYVQSVIEQDVEAVPLYWRTGSTSACDSGDKLIYSESLVKLCGKVQLPANALYQGSLSYPHTETDCTASGGTLITSSGAVATTGNGYFCRFNSSSCPSGWIRYGNWSKTTNSTGSCANYSNSTPYSYSYYNTGSHNWGNVATEGVSWSQCSSFSGTWCGCNVCGSGCHSGSVSAIVNQIGCY
ncbi:MAG: hypothetical protein PHU17_02785 [Candidatus Pacebacteria bacterium]|nr:hypothetical protein [Candidatus Paceibacterota bacterium]